MKRFFIYTHLLKKNNAGAENCPFLLQCQRRAENEYPQPRGQKKANVVKYFMGGGCLMGIIAVIWFPLVLFALGNTVGEPNLPSEMSISVEIGSFQPIYKYTVRNNSIDRYIICDCNPH